MIAVVTTVFNDRKGTAAFLQSMREQTLQPSEVIIVDGGSRDGTWEMLSEAADVQGNGYRLKIHQEVGCNVARGRDLAIELASFDLIVSTDIGCEWDPEWIEELSAPLRNDPTCDLVIGSWGVKREGLEGPWAMTEWGLKGDQNLEATPDSYSSSRSIAYRRATWEALGRYPQDLTLAADDAVFHYLIEQANVPRSSAPVIRCYWHRHKKLKSFLREASRYGLGDGEAAIRMKDHGLIAGRLLLEAVGLVAGGLGAVFLTGWPATVCVALLSAAILSFLARVARLLKARSALKREGINWPMSRLLAFVYGTKFNSSVGYLKGLLRGKTACRSCRRRLQEMTPQLYAERRSASASAERSPTSHATKSPLTPATPTQVSIGR